MTNHIDLSREVARRYDQHLTALVVAALDPYPGTVFILDDYDDRIKVRVGGPGGPNLTIPIDRYAFPYPPTPEELALDVARRLRAAWRSLPPLEAPANVVLGAD